MIVSSIFIIVERKSTPKQIAASTEQTESLEITESCQLTEPADKKELSEQPDYPGEKGDRSVVNKEKP